MPITWYISQALGFIAFGVSCIALSKKNDSEHRIINSIAAFIDVVHWLLLYAYTAAATALVICIRVLTAEFFQGYTRSLKVLIALVYCSIFLYVMYLTWEDNYSVLPTLAALIASFAFMLSGGIILRICLLICNLLWIIYSLHTYSVAGLVTHTIANVILLKVLYELRYNENLYS